MILTIDTSPEHREMPVLQPHRLAGQMVMRDLQRLRVHRGREGKHPAPVVKMRVMTAHP